METKVFSWADGSHIQLPADKVGAELERIAAKEDGITAPVLVEKARSPKSAMHPYFEWNDSEAGRLYREGQARHILACIRVQIEVPDREPMETRAFVSILRPDGDGQKQTYIPTVKALADDEIRSQVIGDVVRMIEQARNRLNEYERVIGSLDNVQGKLQEITAELRATANAVA